MIDNEEFFDWYFTFRGTEVFYEDPPMELSPEIAHLWSSAKTIFEDLNEAINQLEDIAWKEQD